MEPSHSHTCAAAAAAAAWKAGAVRTAAAVTVRYAAWAHSALAGRLVCVHKVVVEVAAAAAAVRAVLLSR
jgi:hypothetical protein